MLEKPFLRRLIVVGSHHQRRIRTHIFRELDQADGLGGGIRPGSGDDRNPFACNIGHSLDDPLMLLMAESRAFAGRSDRNETVRTLCDVPLDQVRQSLEIDCPVIERGYQRRN